MILSSIVIEQKIEIYAQKGFQLNLVKAGRTEFQKGKRVMETIQKGATMERRNGFGEGGIRTFQFEYVGNKKV